MMLLSESIVISFIANSMAKKKAADAAPKVECGVQWLSRHLTKRAVLVALANDRASREVREEAGLQVRPTVRGWAESVLRIFFGLGRGFVLVGMAE
jgi:hypothetical protein